MVRQRHIYPKGTTMIVTRHYNRNQQNRKRNRIHPDAELNEALAKREIRPSEMSDSAMLRGAGVVQSRKVAPATRRKRVKANAGYWNGSRRVVSDRAPMWEVLQDAKMRPRKGTARKVEKGKVHVQTNADIALMAKMGTIHDPNEN
jgi:hypothetical protein